MDFPQNGISAPHDSLRSFMKSIWSLTELRRGQGDTKTSVGVTVTNTGPLAGDEIVQLWIVEERTFTIAVGGRQTPALTGTVHVRDTHS